MIAAGRHREEVNCTPFRTPDGAAGFVCTRGQRRSRCSAPGCTSPASLACDGPSPPRSRRKTCDAKLCPAHATTEGDRDLCAACVHVEGVAVAVAYGDRLRRLEAALRTEGVAEPVALAVLATLLDAERSPAATDVVGPTRTPHLDRIAAIFGAEGVSAPLTERLLLQLVAAGGAR